MLMGYLEIIRKIFFKKIVSAITLRAQRFSVLRFEVFGPP
jgi:hypothetical protein